MPEIPTSALIPTRRIRVTFHDERQALPAIDALALLVSPPLAALVPLPAGGVALLVGVASGRYGALRVVLEDLGLAATIDTPGEVALLPVRILRAQLRGELPPA